MLIFFQTGGPGTLPEAVRCAKRHVRDIAVVSDVDYLQDSTIQRIAHREVSEMDSHFDAVYRHRSPCAPQFETICIRRWFSIRRAMRLLGVSRAFCADSDCLVCCEPLKQPQVQGASLALSTAEPGTTCTAGMSVQTELSLGLFEQLAFRRFFQDGMHERYASTDMGIWTALVREWAPGVAFGWSEMNRVMDGCVFDHHLGVTSGFQSGPDGGKSLHFRGGYPYTKTLDGAEVRLCAMHCWQKWKPNMARYNLEMERS